MSVHKTEQFLKTETVPILMELTAYWQRPRYSKEQINVSDYKLWVFKNLSL